MKPIFLMIGFLLSFSACQTGSPENDSSVMSQSKEMTRAMEETQSSDGDQPTELQATEQKLIRNGHMTIKVDNALQAKNEISTVLTKHKAYIGNEHFDNNDYSASYQLQVRVPAENLDALIAELETVEGEVTNKSVNATDVTEEFIDLEARLTNKRAYLDQYRQLLKNARTIEDILKVREQIRVLEEEIESVEGRLKYIRNQVALSTLDLTLYEEKAYVYHPDMKINLLERLKEAISSGWYGFINFCLLLLQLWPFWLVLLVAIWLLKRFSKKNRNTPPPPSSTISNS